MNLSLPAYICGPLTELDPQTREKTKRLYENLASLCLDALGVRAFVPHEHYDPIKHASFTPQEVDTAERTQVCEKTSILIVVAILPSWGGGIEVEMAYRSNVPIILLIPKNKKTSRLLRGNPGIKCGIEYNSEIEALAAVKYELLKLREEMVA